MTAKDLAARASAVSSRRKAPEAAETAPAKPVQVRTDPVRLSTDISPNAYRGLIAYCSDVAAQAGKARVAHTLVLRKLIDALQDDAELRQQITESVLAELRN